MKDFKYKVTMIVPIYNMEDFLAGCLDSLVAQTINPDDMEILLIDDGSPDNSIDIMNEYAKKYSNMKILRKENEGLSMTRNYGIKRAQGKYIMYIDADDTITPETVESVTNFFDNHYDEVDLVSYPEVPIINGKKSKRHFRYNTLYMSGVYDLNCIDNAFICQTRINICVKNLGEENVLFDFDREFRHEDQKYCTQVLQKKMKLGFCNEGLYNYLHQPQSIVRTFFYAYYIFEKTMKFWEEIFAYYGDGEVPYYIQALYLNDVSWKTISDILLPYHYDEEKFAEAKNRVVRLLNKVSDKVILLHPGVDGFHRQFFINLKTGNEIKVMTGPNQVVVTNHDSVIYETKKIEIILTKFKLKNDTVKMMGFVKSALFNHIDKPDLYMILNGKHKAPKPVEIIPSSWSYYRAKTKTNNFWCFNLEFDVNKIHSVQFKIEVLGELIDCSYFFMPTVVFNNKRQRYRYTKDGMDFRFNNGIFYLNEGKSDVLLRKKKALQSKYKKSDKFLWFFRNRVMHFSKKYNNVWLYHDCKGVKPDNAYYQFTYDFEMNDGVKRYYVVNEDDFVRVRRTFPKKYRKNIIKFGSRLHRLLFLKARKVITAFIEINNYRPYTNVEYQKMIDISNQPDIIYLQHGVLHAHVPWKYSLDRLLIDKEIVSTNYEKENLIKNYCFNEKSIIASGMPRYDFMDTEVKSVNRILFAPSWRKYLVGMDKDGWITIESKFLNSKFFEETSKFLNSKELEDLLVKNDFYLDFKLHPILERYKHLYNITNPRVNMAESKVSEMEYSIFMTDFSSFVFDFVYLQKPIVYFMPDYDVFRSGMNDYRELDIPFEDAFGDLALSSEEAISALDKLLSNNCTVEKKYADKMKDFFIYKDNNQRERIYNELIKD